MAIVKASELAYCRVQVPDLDLAEQFLLDFGLVAAEREPQRRFYRGTDPSPYCYILEEGPAHFLGFAFHAKSRADLEAFSAATGSPVEAIDAPGGGSRVRVQEPNGYDVDLVFGIAPAPAIAVERQPNNSAAQPLLRKGELYRLRRGAPTPVRRLAHVVLGSPKVRETIDWFHETLGTISSDEVTAGPQKQLIGAFIRVDDGDDYVDHHAVFIIANGSSGLQHISFEAQDIDAVLADHHYLASLGRYEHMWGVGRHLLGSQVFDYWADPFGYSHEHWADSDRLNAAAETNHWDAREGMITQWGDEPPERFRNCVRP
ncbi:VOC family protein [Sphingobium chungangianum]